MRKFTVEIQATPDTHDSDDVSFIEIKRGIKIGSGFRSKDDGRFHITRCPRCHAENYAMQVSEGSCAWCGLDPNKE